MNYERFFNEHIKQLRGHSGSESEASLKRKSDDLIDLSIGTPHPETFPFIKASVKLGDGSLMEINKETLDVALQYTNPYGHWPLVDWFKLWQKKIHDPPTCHPDHPGGMECIFTEGNMGGLSQTASVLAGKGDNVLFEQPAFPPFASLLSRQGSDVICVESDKDGLNPDNLRRALSNWKPSDVLDATSAIPKLLYCLPSAQNPMGTCLTLERKKDIYQIAQEYDLLILEDDPYYFLQYTEEPVPSFLSLDVDGRVLRFDSFSKTVSSGMRMGVITGPAPIMKAIALRQLIVSGHASGLSQMFLYAFVTKLGHDGFIEYLNEKRDFYREKRNICLKAATKHLSGLADWDIPVGGIFLWIRLRKVTNAFDMLNEIVGKGVLLITGNMMRTDNQTPSPYVRIAYSIPTEQQMDTAFSRLAELLKDLTTTT